MKADLAQIAKDLGTPIYVYDAEVIQNACRELKKNLPGTNLYYACKANNNPEIIKIIYKEGFGVETVSPGEINKVKSAGVPISKIIFTCSNITETELLSVIKQGIKVHLDSLHQVEVVGKHFKGSEISVRLNQGIGAGHHSHVITGGPDSKFGIDISQVEQLKTLAQKYNLKITGLHQHIGSNVLDASMLAKAMQKLLNTALLFPDIQYLDFGGGFGIAYKPEDKNLNVKKFGVEVKKILSKFTKETGKKLEISFEPGRYPVAESGALLVEVTDIKNNPTKTFVGVNSGFNHLIRPAMYGSYHEIINVSNPKGKKPARPNGRSGWEKVTIAGNVCESGDVFAKDRLLQKARIGDILAIKNAGAYGYVMASVYNSRPLPKEFLILGNKIKRI